MAALQATWAIERVEVAEAEATLPDLVRLLQDAVGSGASLGFWRPLGDSEAERYWRNVFADLREGRRILLIARQAGAVVGSVQLELVGKPNGRERAEVQKLMTLLTARRQGIGRALLTAIEGEALALGRTLLVLDTRTGDAAEMLYRRHGYTEVGCIPGFVVEPDGTRNATTIFYRRLAN